MFNTPNKTENTSNKKNEENIVQDFITHNMPAPHRFSGQTFSSQETVKSDRAISNSGPESHHKIGLLIIVGGLILVIALIYFGYSYFIKPMLNQSTEVITSNITATETPVVETPKVETVLPVEIIATSTPEISTSTINMASSSEPTFAEETPVILAPVTVSTIDSDADGLTDSEEKIIATDPNKADTDSDGYLDLAELKSDYDPLIPGQKNSETSKTITYKVDTKATVIYPSLWEVNRNDDLGVVIFSNPDDAFIQISYQDNPGKINPKIWFEQEFSGLLPGEMVTGDSWQGFYSQDGLAAYIFNKDLSKIYSFSCSPLTSDTSSVTLFHLMIKTLSIK